ncbi:MAG TPA: glycosyltransferase family 2 protein [Solirubrobacteraceae bacterium]|nr:glycosyltransferase family 2 protein [Solirubrobacteraceae bacterium]
MAAPKVSVVVPVYNPGSHVDDCIRTLVHEQSLPRDEYEVIFVDDGSTDDTPARLDALAAEHDHVRVEHIENSGWSGRPRNVGIEMARGEFVYFVDNADWIAPQALERMHAMAVRDDADVVIGKVVGYGPGKLVPKTLFVENRSGIKLGDWASILWLLSPHKLFRRAMLDEHDIRFPEGRRRLEDHLFVMHAYFHARSISVLADYPCYHWLVREGDNASLRPFDPAEYYGNVRDVLDLIDEHTEPGELRDRLYTRWLRGKLLGRAGGPPFLKWDEAYRRERYEEIRRLTLERFHEGVDALLPLSWRVRAKLVRAGDYEGLKALAAYEAGLRVDARAKPRAAGDAVELRIKARFADDAVRFYADEDTPTTWTPPPGVSFEEDRDAGDDFEKSDLYVFLRSPADRVEYALPVDFAVDYEEEHHELVGQNVVLRGTARLDPRTAAAGAPLPPGDWDAFVTLTVAGFKATGRLHSWRRGPLRFTVGGDGRLVEDRADLRARLATRWPRAARIAKRAGL